MKAHVEYNFREGVYDVTLHDRHAVYTLSGYGTLVPHAKSERAAFTEPTLRLPGEALEALLREAGKVIQANDQTVDALNDARTVRDRLLKLIEDAW